MRQFIFLFAFFGLLRTSGQETLKTYYGRAISPIDTIFILDVFININYDLCQTCDPYYRKSTPIWQPGDNNTVNDSPSEYIIDYIAQELLDVVPEAVVYDSVKEEYGIRYNCLIPILIEAIKEQDKKIKEQDKKIKLKPSVQKDAAAGNPGISDYI
jgi:hypothetical protein